MNYRSRRIANQRNLRARSEHELWLEKRGLSLKQLKAKRDPSVQVVAFPDYKVREHLPLSNGFANAGFKNTAMSNRFKETPEVRKEIERKANSIAPAFNKAGYSYISNKDDAKYVGRK